MKKVVATIIITVAILVTIATNCFYPTSMVVREVNREEDIFTAVDFNGEAWEFTECEDWEENDVCAVIMFTKFTKSVEDDIPISIKYCGWIE